MKTFRVRNGKAIGFTKKARQSVFDYTLTALNGDVDKANSVVDEFEKTEVKIANNALSLGYSI